MVLFLWLVAVAVVQVPAGNAPADAEVTTLARLEADWNAAHARGDAAALEHLFADDVVVMVPGMRVMTKADAVGMFTPFTSMTRGRMPTGATTHNGCGRAVRYCLRRALPPATGRVAARFVRKLRRRRESNPR